jgi:hypothetical protein
MPMAIRNRSALEMRGPARLEIANSCEANAGRMRACNALPLRYVRSGARIGTETGKSITLSDSSIPAVFTKGSLAERL